MSFVDRFHAGFNHSFDKITNKYKKGVERIINNRVVTGISVVAGIVALVFFMGTTKTGLIPDEDTGTLFCTISPPRQRARTRRWRLARRSTPCWPPTRGSSVVR